MTEDFYGEADRRRRARLEEMKRNKEKQLRQRRILKILVPPVLVLVLVLGVSASIFSGRHTTKQNSVENGQETGMDGRPHQVPAATTSGTAPTLDAATDMAATADTVTDTQSQTDDTQSQTADIQNQEAKNQENTSTVMNHTAIALTDIGAAAIKDVSGHTYYARKTENTKTMNGDVYSNYGIFIDKDSNTILAERNGTTRINPASMTKILTVLVAAEQLEGKDCMEEHFTMTLEITDYSFVHDCSNVGFLEGEVVTVRDLFYGTVLPSGADAAVGLATYVAGSHEAFVELMNDKIKELGLSETTHVTNCVGIYDEDHYSTVYDMAMIMEAAMDHELCREIMGQRTYTTSATEQHPEGITVSNWFIRRIEDKDTGGSVLCAKTGYVVQSGNCAASYGRDAAGREYICVTADAHSSWRCIYDHVALYSQFFTAKEEDS